MEGKSKRKHYAGLSILLLAISEAITVLPTVIIVPDISGEASISYLVWGAIIFVVAMGFVLFGNLYNIWYSSFSMRLNMKNGENVQYIPSKFALVSGGIGVVIFGIVGCIFNIIQLAFYLP
ncbi:MAG: hypothetical protein K2M36_00930 [Clostridia bacterium]|nr:hypothetical protein [Clostridia bacterium]